MSDGGGGGSGGTVRAAGCLLWRRCGQGPEIEVALVHRPKYDDWSWPKGKLKPGEDAEACAVREVLEETGMRCVLGAALPTSRYLADGRLKEVRYWAARALGGSFRPTREVDRVLWLPPTEARSWVTHDRDRPLLDALLLTWDDTIY